MFHKWRKIKWQVIENLAEQQTRKRIEEIKAAIRQMGNINVNAIEDYKEMSQRHGTL